VVATIASPTTGYFFADCELDVVRGCLICGGREEPLRYQSFQLLKYFVEHPGVLISKDELTAAIWSDTSVTDNALVQCVAEIRRALKDDPRSPRYIKTFSKVGYRFIANVEVNCEPVAHPNLAPSQLQQQRSHPALTAKELKTSPPLRLFRSIPRSVPVSTWLSGWWRLAFIGLLALALVFLYGDKAHTVGLARDISSSVSGPPILAVFSLENATGRSDLDWLREGLSDMILTDLARTHKWNVLSRERIHTLLDDHGSPSALAVNRELEAARSVHARDFIIGTLSTSGQQITIQVETRDGRDGHLVASDSTLFSDPREIVAEASLLSADIARHLGFATDAALPLADVMTRNVEAYRYYSLGVEKAERFQNSQAIELFKKALEFDPQFAMAYARIGYAYAVQDFQPEKARPYLDRAVRFSKQLPTMNRMYIEAWSAIAHSDYNAAIGILRQITIQYPDETEAYCQLSRILRGQERIDEAAVLLKSAIQKNPDAKDLYNGYGLILVSMARPLEAIEAYKQYVALAPDNPNAHDSLGMSYQLAGQYDAALSEYNQALTFDPEFEPAIVHLGDIDYQQGRYRDALREYQRYIQVVRSNDARAIGYGDLATVYLAMGDLSRAQVAATEELGFNHKSAWNSLTIALAKHQAVRARGLATILFADLPDSERGSPRDLRMEFFYRGYIELRNGDAQGAISHFKSALQHLPPSSGIDLHEDCLANAYLELGMNSEAIAEYRRVLKLNPNYPLAYYHLGLAYQRLHDRLDANAAFQHFLQATPSADQDSPAVLDATRNLQLRMS
jgi:tetratricopeptide (TPR) repeat protein/DNA-binding winged helix-turn-helix (wHTH) protein